MSNELSNNGEFKQDYEWEDVIPEQDKTKEELWSPEIVGETIHIPDRGQLTKKERETR